MTHPLLSLPLEMENNCLLRAIDTIAFAAVSAPHQQPREKHPEDDPQDGLGYGFH